MAIRDIITDGLGTEFFGHRKYLYTNGFGLFVRLRRRFRKVVALRRGGTLVFEWTNE